MRLHQFTKIIVLSISILYGNTVLTQISAQTAENSISLHEGSENTVLHSRPNNMQAARGDTVLAKRGNPAGWTLELVNEQTGRRYDLREYDKIPVSMSHVRAKSARSLPDGNSVVAKGKNGHTELTLVIQPGLDAHDLPQSFKLHQNYPNPFNPATTFRFQLPLESSVRIEIFNMLGRRVSTLVNGTLPAGVHERIWDASRFSSGTYIARMVSGNDVFVRKLTLIK